MQPKPGPTAPRRRRSPGVTPCNSHRRRGVPAAVARQNSRRSARTSESTGSRRRSRCGRTEKSPEQLLDGRSRLNAIEIEIGPAIVPQPNVMAGKDFNAVNKVIVLDRSVDPYASRHQREHQEPPSDRRAEARTDREADRDRPDEVESADREDGQGRSQRRSQSSQSGRRRDMGQVRHIKTRTDTKGRKQPARKTRRSRPQFRRRCCNSARPPPNAFAAVSGAATRSATTSAPRTRTNANGCVHATKNCKPSFRAFRVTEHRAPRRARGIEGGAQARGAKTRAKIVNLATCCVRGIAHRRAHARNSRRASGSSQSSPLRRSWTTGSTSPNAYGGPRHDHARTPS